MSTEQIIEKVAKLLKLSKDKGATDAEAMSALAMAQKLMAKHNIEASDLEVIEEEQPIIRVYCEHKWNAGFRQQLGAIISANYRCKCYISGGIVVFLGHKEDAWIAKQAFEFAYRFIYKRGNQEYERVKKEGYDGSGVFNSYAIGFLKGLNEVLAAQSKALMIVVPQDVIDEYSNISFRKGRGGMHTDGVYKDIYDRGYNDAHDQYGNRALSAGN